LSENSVFIESSYFSEFNRSGMSKLKDYTVAGSRVLCC